MVTIVPPIGSLVRYLMHIALNGVDIKNSPITFEAEAASPVPQQCELLLPVGADAHPADLDNPATVTLRTCDKFGNECKIGGLRIQVRLPLLMVASLPLRSPLSVCCICRGG